MEVGGRGGRSTDERAAPTNDPRKPSKASDSLVLVLVDLENGDELCDVQQFVELGGIKSAMRIAWGR